MEVMLLVAWGNWEVQVMAEGVEEMVKGCKALGMMEVVVKAQHELVGWLLKVETVQEAGTPVQAREVRGFPKR